MGVRRDQKENEVILLGLVLVAFMIGVLMTGISIGVHLSGDDGRRMFGWSATIIALSIMGGAVVYYTGFGG